MHDRLLRLAVVVVAFAASGATCNRAWLPSFPGTGPTAPVVLTPGAQIEQIAAAVNQNSSRVQSLTAPYATITVPDAGALVPPLRGNLALERPQRFRLTAGTTLTGQEVDLGSNDERFWLWIKRNQPPTVYLCRHDQFGRSAAHRLMPIEPQWLHSALGLVEIDPAAVYQGPTIRNDGSILLRTHVASLAGPLHRELVIDGTYGWVREQHVYDTTGQHLIASAVAHSHSYDQLQQVSLPEKVTIRLPTAQMAFTIELGQVAINQPAANPAQLWSMPAFEGYQQVDLGTAPANMLLPASGFGMGQSTPVNVTAPPAQQQAVGQLQAPAVATTAAQSTPQRRRLFFGRTAGDQASRWPILSRLRRGVDESVQPASYQSP